MVCPTWHTLNRITLRQPFAPTRARAERAVTIALRATMVIQKMCEDCDDKTAEYWLSVLKNGKRERRKRWCAECAKQYPGAGHASTARARHPLVALDTQGQNMLDALADDDPKVLVKEQLYEYTRYTAVPEHTRTGYGRPMRVCG